MKSTPTILIFTLISFNISWCQSIIKGKITNNQNEPVSYVNVTISKINETLISTYDISDINGRYELSVDLPDDSITIKLTHVGYTDVKKVIPNKTQTFDPQLTESTVQLKEVAIEGNAPIIHKGDTISYNVDSFKKQNDRVIADVLEKLPGIEVESDGKILYQGKPIQKYYIEGLDLLEGRYNLANNNLPADDVSRVQILENHQPIKLLDSLLFSDRASLNIKLKKSYTFATETNLGMGGLPLLWNVNITPMLFTKKQQFLGSYQSNNVGNDVSKELRQFTINELADQLDTRKKNWLDIQTLTTPPFSQKQWLDNNIHMATANYLTKWKKNYNVKIGINYYTDKQNRIGNTQTTFYTPSDTINIVEYKSSQYQLNALQSSLTLEKNTSSKYLKNKLEVEKQWDTKSQTLTGNADIINEQVSTPYELIKNKFSLLFPLGKKIITLRSHTSYMSNDQQLIVAPGQFSELLNDSLPYDKSFQKLSHRSFSTYNDIGFTTAIHHFTFTPQVGFSINTQCLTSEIKTKQDSNDHELSKKFQNDLVSTHSVIHSKLGIEYKFNDWVLKCSLPLKYYTIEQRDYNLYTAPNLNYVAFEPRISIYNKINAHLGISLTARINNDFGDIQNQYRGFILSRYRTIQRNNNQILINKRQAYSFDLDYKDALKSFFSSISYYYLAGQRNVMFNSFISDKGFVQTETLNLNNTSQSHNLSTKADKFFATFNSGLKVVTTYSISKTQRFLNNDIANIVNSSLSIKPSVYTNITDWLTVEYKGSFSWLTNGFLLQSFQRIMIQKHALDLITYISEHQYFKINGEYYNNNYSQNPNNYFLNINYQYTLNNPKIVIGVEWNNILNTRSFISVYNDPYSYVSNTYLVRPSQILLNIKFGIR